MGRLIIDGNSFFEIDEECIKKKKLSKACDMDKYLKEKNYKEKGEYSPRSNLIKQDSFENKKI